MSYSTSNGYFRAMRTFCRWLVRSKRAPENPIAGVTCMKVTDADRKRRRRPINDAEVAALVQAARESADAFMGLPGPDRAILYIVAVNTGLRASELASLAPASFEVDASQPLVRCLGGYTKNGVEAVLPLRSDVAAMLRTWLANKPAGEPVRPGKWASQRHGAEMMRIDLSNANVDYQDARKRVADFHALRHTFIFPLRQGFAGRANLARAGVHPRNAQALARHSTIDLTMNVYTHIEMGDLAGDVENLPALSGHVGLAPKANTPASVAAHATAPAIPAEIASLASNWSALPDHIRHAIATLAGA